MKSDLSTESLAARKSMSRAYLRSLPLDEKIARLVDLQERYYELLAIRASNGGRPIPSKWQKWREAKRTGGLSERDKDVGTPYRSI
ncbi:MAG: hypothetical protein WKF34_01370 [Pyrinomonadaceae bacterium]